MRIAYAEMFSFIALALLALSPGHFLSAEVVTLKNGSRLEGKAIDNRQKTGEVIVEIGDRGRLILLGSQVEKIEPSAPKAEKPAGRDREFVSVKVTKGGDYYGEAVYQGFLSPESDDKTVVLDLPSGGKVRIPRAVAQITKAEAPREKPASVEKTIKTTHTLRLANGRTISGNLIPTPQTEPVKLQIGNLGVITISRDKIAPNGIEEASGVIRLPEEPPPPKEAASQEKPAISPEAKEEMKREIRAELLRELLDRVIDEKIEGKVDSAAHGSIKSSSFEGLKGLTNDQILAIQDEVRELCRERTRNRVRAENHLRSLGSVVLPYLAPVAHHPFDLTRSAVQRLVRDIGDPRGAPLAIDALNDPDKFVRELAREALEKILPSSIAYRPNASEKDRLKAQAEYRMLWDSMLRSQAREAILRQVAEK